MTTEIIPVITADRVAEYIDNSKHQLGIRWRGLREVNIATVKLEEAVRRVFAASVEVEPDQIRPFRVHGKTNIYTGGSIQADAGYDHPSRKSAPENVSMQAWQYLDNLTGNQAIMNMLELKYTRIRGDGKNISCDSFPVIQIGLVDPFANASPLTLDFSDIEEGMLRHFITEESRRRWLDTRDSAKKLWERLGKD